MKKQSATYKLALCGLLITIGLMFSYIEALLPPLLPVPGLKLGLTHIVTLFALYRLGARLAIPVTLLRAFIAALLFATPASLIFSLGGAFFALTAMLLLKPFKLFSVFGVSIAGAAAHHIGQILVAAIQGFNCSLYLAYLLPASIPTGLLIAFVYLLVSRAIDS